MAWGHALPIDGSSNEGPASLKISSCLDWCIDYGDPPALWLITPHAWSASYSHVSSLSPSALSTCACKLMSLSSPLSPSSCFPPPS